MARGAEIKTRVFVPQTDGTYKPWSDLTKEERKAVSDWAVEQVGQVFNNYFSQHPEVYEKI